jgi:hypothetical protein
MVVVAVMTDGSSAMRKCMAVTAVRADRADGGEWGCFTHPGLAARNDGNGRSSLPNGCIQDLAPGVT